LRCDAYALPSDGEWLEREGSSIPNNSCSQAADELERCAMLCEQWSEGKLPEGIATRDLVQAIQVPARGT